ncbi:MAG: hypothetical protein R3B72_01385 [Polyangiaceae bacterium]
MVLRIDEKGRRVALATILSNPNTERIAWLAREGPEWIRAAAQREADRRGWLG